ncbi:MAG: hypothetical protein QNI97_03565, partial [Desulfobacterales bacterium]|nr:hypothetical protein [Desulfobacterales bacterium]
SENLTDSFTYTLSDADGGVTDTGTVSITITPVNDAPTVTLINTATTIAFDADTSTAIKVADIVVTDDAMGTNGLALSGADAAMFEIVGGNELYLKAGSILDADANPTLDVIVAVDDAGVGGTPDATTTLTMAVSGPFLPPPPEPSIVPETGGGEDPSPDPETDAAEPAEPSSEPADLASDDTDPAEAPTPAPEPDAEAVPAESGAARSSGVHRGETGRRFPSIKLMALDWDVITARLLPFENPATPAEDADPGVPRAERQVRIHNVMASRIYTRMVQTLNAVQQEMTGDIAFDRTVLGSAIVMSTGLSVGYVVWLMRGGMLLSSLLSSLPAWQLLDPLPILARRKDDDNNDDDESLESILERKPDPPDPQTRPVGGSGDHRWSRDKTCED